MAQEVIPKLKVKAPYVRPAKLTDEVMEEIMERICNGELLSQILKSDRAKFGESSAFHKVLRYEAEWRRMYTEARIDQMHVFADSVIEISQDDSKDVMTTPIYGKDGELKRLEQRSDNTAVNRHKLEVTTKLFLMSRLAGNHYAEKQQVEHSGQVKIIPVLEYGVDTRGLGGAAKDGAGEPRIGESKVKSLASASSGNSDESD